jgi:hypothetical protein
MRPVSERRLAANRANAQKSTGPHTPKGRRRSSLNATRHDILSPVLHLPEEELATFSSSGRAGAFRIRELHNLLALRTWANTGQLSGAVIRLESAYFASLSNSVRYFGGSSITFLMNTSSCAASTWGRLNERRKWLIRLFAQG